jgi:hypothetical protein
VLSDTLGGQAHLPLFPLLALRLSYLPIEDVREMEAAIVYQFSTGNLTATDSKSLLDVRVSQQ